MIYGASQHRAAYASRTFAYRFELGVAGGLRTRSRIEADRAEEVVGTQSEADCKGQVCEGVRLGF